MRKLNELKKIAVSLGYTPRDCDTIDEVLECINTGLRDIIGDVKNDPIQLASLTSLDKLLINIDAAAEGVLYNSTTDESVAYEKANPEGVLPYAELNYVGGMSVVENETFKHGVVTNINELVIPNEVKALDGYGLGVNSSVYNYIDFKTKKYVQRVKKVILNGSEYWDEYSNQGQRLEGTYCYRYIVSDSVIGMKKSLCDSFTFKSSAWDTGNIGEYCDHPENTTKYFITNIATLTEWKTYLTENPITLIYELAEPIETDISPYIHDNHIIAAADGSTTFENEHQLSVPSSVKYQVKL